MHLRGKFPPLVQSGREKMIPASEREAGERQLSSSLSLLPRPSPAHLSFALKPGGGLKRRGFFFVWKRLTALPIAPTGGRRFPRSGRPLCHVPPLSPRPHSPTGVAMISPRLRPLCSAESPQVLLFFSGFVPLPMYRPVSARARCQRTMLRRRFCTAETTSRDKRGQPRGL